MSDPELTPSQTIGPFLSIGVTWDGGEFAVPAGHPGAIWLRGIVLDGNGTAVPDALIETWQADADGRFDHPDDPRGPVARVDGVTGFGRSATGPDGSWAVCTVKPGPIKLTDGTVLAPHIDVSIFARGLLDRLVTRLYFADEDDANRSDPVLSGVPPARRATLMAQPAQDGYRLDIRLRGADETVFFDL